MGSQSNEVRQIAAQLYAAMLSNPHIFTNLSDEGVHGQQEQTLMLVAIEMAEVLIKKTENRNA